MSSKYLCNTLGGISLFLTLDLVSPIAHNDWDMSRVFETCLEIWLRFFTTYLALEWSSPSAEPLWTDPRRAGSQGTSSSGQTGTPWGQQLLVIVTTLANKLICTLNNVQYQLFQKDRREQRVWWFEMIDWLILMDYWCVSTWLGRTSWRPFLIGYNYYWIDPNGLLACVYLVR